MMKALGFLFGLVALALIAQPAAAYRFDIHVQYENGAPVNRAFIEIYEGDNLVDSDYTDSDGTYTAYLGENFYRFHATKNGMSGSKGSRDSYVSITIRPD